jgi:hypothetical protein
MSLGVAESVFCDSYIYIYIYRVSQEECARLREGMTAQQPDVSCCCSSDEEEMEIEFRHRRQTDTASMHGFTGPPYGIKQSAAPNISPESSPFTIFLLFF